MRNWKMIGIACAVVLAAARSAMAMEGHEFLINVPEARVDTDHTNSDSNYWEHAIVGYVGKPIYLSITYSIGPYAAPDTGGSMTLEFERYPQSRIHVFLPER